ncbi:MAG: hypothetical protein RI989_1043 [Bacteroidota bacterium]
MNALVRMAEIRKSIDQEIVLSLEQLVMQKNIPASVFSFLEELKENNNREWFQVNKERYHEQYHSVALFADTLLSEMKQCDNIETVSGKKSLFRIHKDVRFSKDKSPYKTNIGGAFTRATKELRGGYYFHIEPGNCFLGGGFWGPSPEDLKHIRLQIAADPEPLREILSSKEFISTFGKLEGEQLKTAPKGFDKDHPAIDLINFKQFLLVKNFTDKQAQSEKYLENVFATFQAMRPFFDYMSEILTTDLNGEPL